MPQASDDTVEHMKRLFGRDSGHGVFEQRAVEFLNTAGYKEVRFFWLPKPGVVTVDDMTMDEYMCMWYLCTEWDWGMLAPPDLVALVTNSDQQEKS